MKNTWQCKTFTYNNVLVYAVSVSLLYFYMYRGNDILYLSENLVMMKSFPLPSPLHILGSVAGVYTTCHNVHAGLNLHATRNPLTCPLVGGEGDL